MTQRPGITASKTNPRGTQAHAADRLPHSRDMSCPCRFGLWCFSCWGVGKGLEWAVGQVGVLLKPLFCFRLCWLLIAA